MITENLSRADLEFTTGVETEVAKSGAILVGAIKGYQQNVKRFAEGSTTKPVDWEVTGEIETARSLKGRPPAGPVSFVREERSFMLPALESKLYWEHQYGNLLEAGQAVVFLAEGAEPSVLRIVPTGQGEHDLARLVSDIVRLKSLPSSKEKFQGWTEYLASGETNEGRKVSWRVLCSSGVKWERLKPHFAKELSNARVSAELRAYGFSILAYHIVHDRWPRDSEDAVEFVCGLFEREPDAGLALAYLSNLGLIANFCHDDRYRAEREPILSRVLECVKQRKKLAIRGGPSVDSEEEAYYKEVRADILAAPEPLESDDEP